MRTRGLDACPVVDADGYALGVITIGRLRALPA
jgi:hypothetical protein